MSIDKQIALIVLVEWVLLIVALILLQFKTDTYAMICGLLMLLLFVIGMYKYHRSVVNNKK